MTPLHVAAERGCVIIVKYLVGKGGDINIQDENGVHCDCSYNVVLLFEFELAVLACQSNFSLVCGRLIRNHQQKHL